MKVLDAHVHVFEMLKGFGPKGELRALGGGLARWSNGDEVGMLPQEYGDKEFTGEALIRVMDENQVDRSVLLQGSFYGFQNEYTYEVWNKYKSRLIAAGTLDPFCRMASQIYDRLVNQFCFPVIKFETSSGGGLMGYHRPYVIDEVLKPYIRHAAETGRTLVLDIGSPGMESFQPEAVARIARQYPQLKLVVCHLMAPGLRDEEELKRSLSLLAFDNVWFDLAAVPFNVMPETYPYPTGRRYIKLAKELVGHKKLIWGSDVPSVLVHDSYKNLLTYITESGLFEEEQLQDVCCNNALDAYPFSETI